MLQIMCKATHASVTEHPRRSRIWSKEQDMNSVHGGVSTVNCQLLLNQIRFHLSRSCQNILNAHTSCVILFYFIFLPILDYSTTYN